MSRLPNARRVLLWLLTICMPVGVSIVFIGFISMLPQEIKIEIAKKNMAALVGLPSAALFSLFLVIGLQQATGAVRFEGLGFKFEGTSGQIVLWVFCFLAMVASIKLLWVS